MIKKIKKRLKSLYNKHKLLKTYKGNTYHCTVCNSNLNVYLPLPDFYRINAEIHGYKYFGQNEHVNVKTYSCPICGSSDRDRMYAEYFKRFVLPKNSKKLLLHVAPAWKLNDLFLKKHFKVTTTDLMMDGVDYKLDIENMEAFNNNTFDYFICSHVLEHVANPDKALKELYRILKPQGLGIIMAPVIPKLEFTLEDKSHTSEEDRVKYYGQADHLRLFSKKDFMSRIENGGFKLIQYDINKFGEEAFNKLGLKPSSILYIGLKQ
ncbi:class I SAM-dependent methyltransferase [Formosa maritima]|uniref:Methyltransferase domain-containing protein n=1 Tax=Formosa maritima TaxID=2592046 RepID=A0A5D0GFQ7_9FLAO|nr:class I SAM-dependent methyltransferase [Formosa maritima]TYA56637.1 methyltransferase domain-containing protein [Formosa maritima]